MTDSDKKPRRAHVKKKTVAATKQPGANQMPQMAEQPLTENKPAKAVKPTKTKWPTPSKSNTLYLTIKQCYFDEIVAGTKDKEYREIKSTTFKKYLDCTPDGVPYWADDLISEEDLINGEIWVWNNGVYPFFPKESIYYLNLAVGYAKERDSMLIEVVDFSFEPALNAQGQPDRFSDPNNDGHAIDDPNGNLCTWMIVFHLGNIIELHRKGE